MRGIERPCRGVIDGHFENHAAHATTAGFAAERVEEGRSDAGAAPLGHHPERDDLEFFAVTEGEREPDRERILAGDQAQKTGQDGDLRDRFRAPRIRGKGGALQSRQRDR